jgi:hypothetical protein
MSTFHHNYSLNRDRLSDFLRCIAEGKAISNDAIGSFVGVNPYVIRSLRGWLFHTGLGSGKAGNYTISDVGKLVLQYDPYLNLPGTLWVMHYHLASKNPDQHELWNLFFKEYASVGKEFARKELLAYLEHTLIDTPYKKPMLNNDTRALVACYTQPQALGRLEIVQREDRRMYKIGKKQSPDYLIFAYTLFDSWDRIFPERDTLRLSQIHQESGMLKHTFLLEKKQVWEYIIKLQSRGLLVFADTQHEPVTRQIHTHPISLLEQYYQENG